MEIKNKEIVIRFRKFYKSFIKNNSLIFSGKYDNSYSIFHNTILWWKLWDNNFSLFGYNTCISLLELNKESLDILKRENSFRVKASLRPILSEANASCWLLSIIRGNEAKLL